MPYVDPVKQKEAQHNWYVKNKKRIRHRMDQARRADRIRKREYLHEIKKRPCVDCGKSFPFYCMDLDHREMDGKGGNISDMVIGAGWNRFVEEVAKCDTVCAICHRIRTWKQKQDRNDWGSINKHVPIV